MEAKGVTTEIVISLWENQEQLDTEKATRKAQKLTKTLDSLSLNHMRSKPLPKRKKQDVQLASISSGEESAEWKEENNSNSSIYQDPSQVVAGTIGSASVGSLGISPLEALPVVDGDAYTTVWRSSRFLS